MLLHGVHIFLPEVTLVKLLFMNQLAIASKDSTTLKMRRLRSLPVLNLTPQVKLPVLVTSTDFTSITSMPNVHNGMRSVASRLKTITQLLPVLGSLMAQRLPSDHFVVL